MLATVATGRHPTYSTMKTLGVTYSMAEDDNDIESFWEGLRPPREPETPRPWRMVDRATGRVVESQLGESDDIQRLRQRLQERARAQTNSAIERGEISALTQLDYAQVERELMVGLGLHRSQTLEERQLMHELRHPSVSLNTAPSEAFDAWLATQEGQEAMGISERDPSEVQIERLLIDEQRRMAMDRLADAAGVSRERLARFAEVLGTQEPSVNTEEHAQVHRRLNALIAAFADLGITCGAGQTNHLDGSQSILITLEPARDHSSSTINADRNSRGGLNISISFR